MGYRKKMKQKKKLSETGKREMTLRTKDKQTFLKKIKNQEEKTKKRSE
jgi:hypothetical protein